MKSPLFESTRARPFQIAGAAVLLALVAGCSALAPKGSEEPAFYSLDKVSGDAAPPRRAAAIGAAAPTLIVSPSHAASGFNSQRIIYIREAHRLEYYARSEWVDTPARMLAPQIVAALENSGRFRAVVLTPSAAAGDLRLDTEIVRLQHELASVPSRVRFTLRATLVDNRTRQVLAWQQFDESVNSASENPYGAVVAANQAVQTVLDQLANFSANSAAHWRPPADH